VPFSSTPCTIDSTGYPSGKSASGERTRRHPVTLLSAWPSRNPVVSLNRARVITLVNPHSQTPDGNFFVQDALCQHILHWTASCQVTRDPLHCQATRTVCGNVSTPMCQVLRAIPIPVSLQDLDNYQAREPRDQQGQSPRAGPAHPTPTGTTNPKWGKAEHNLPNFSGSTFSSTFHKWVVMRNWCWPVAQPSPSWRHLVGFWGPDCGAINFEDREQMWLKWLKQ